MTRIIVDSSNYKDLSQGLHDSAMGAMSIEKGSMDELIFLGLAFAGEAGELANIVKKIWRDGKTPELVAALEAEIADNLLYLYHLCGALDKHPMEMILDKLDVLYNERKPDWAAAAIRRAEFVQNIHPSEGDM